METVNLGEMDCLKQRLAQLEANLGTMRRQRRRTWVIGSGISLMTAAVVATVLVGTARAVAALGPQPLTVRAPFRIVDGAGALLLQADAGSLRLYAHGHPEVVIGPAQGGGGTVQVLDTSGAPKAAMQARPDGTGEVVVLAPGDYAARLGTTGERPGLRLFHGTTVLGGLASGTSGSTLLLNDATGKKRVLLGQNDFGGAIQVYDLAEASRAFIAIGATGGEFDVQYPNAETAVRLTEGHTGGVLQIANRGGTARVEAGVLSSDRGVMRVFGPGGINYIEGRK